MSVEKSDSLRPVIGFTASGNSPEEIHQKRGDYVKILQEYGAIPVMLTPDWEAVLPCGTGFEADSAGKISPRLLEHLDGLLLPGGGDVHPHYFASEINGANPASINRRLDELELGMTAAALQIDLPIFGICRGCQVLNVAAGGGMLQHFEGHRSTSPTQPNYHDVHFLPGSKTQQILNVERLQVNTHHHQGLDKNTLAQSFVATGLAEPDNWLIEAFESPGHRWVIGVQWHPERIAYLPALHRELWKSFIAACSQHRG